MHSEIPSGLTDAPNDAPRKTIDVRNAGPPEPLKTTLETIEAIDEETVLVQRNDRVPQLLFPKLDDRGYSYDSIEVDDEVITLIWRP